MKILDGRSGSRIGHTAKEVKLIRRRIFNRMLKRKKWWRLWVFSLKVGIRFFLWERNRVEIMLSIYTAMRAIDDGVDGDTELPAGVSAVAFVERYIRFLRHSREPLDDIEKLLIYALDLSKKISIEIRKEMLDIFTSLRFDAGRRSEKELRIPTLRQLVWYFFGRDERGTMRLCLKLSGEDVKGIYYGHLRFLGKPEHVACDIRDLAEDLGANFCNISAEEFGEFGIERPTDLSPEGIRKWCESPGIRNWRMRAAVRGLHALDVHVKKMQGQPLRQMAWRTKVVLLLAFEMPTRVRLETVRSGRNRSYILLMAARLLWPNRPRS